MKATEAQCRLALKQHEDRLLRLANVEGLGVRECACDTNDASFCVAVYVRKGVASDPEDEDPAIPPALSLIGEDRAVTDIPVRVIEIGELKLDGVDRGN